MMLNLARTSYKNKSEFTIIGLRNYSTGIDDKSTHAPTGDSVIIYDEAYFIFVIYICIALIILVWFASRRWNAKTESRQETGHVDFAPPE